MRLRKILRSKGHKRVSNKDARMFVGAYKANKALRKEVKDEHNETGSPDVLGRERTVLATNGDGANVIPVPDADSAEPSRA